MDTSGSRRTGSLDLGSAAPRVHGHANLACELRKPYELRYTLRVSRRSRSRRSAACAVGALTCCLPPSSSDVAVHIAFGSEACRHVEYQLYVRRAQ